MSHLGWQIVGSVLAIAASLGIGGFLYVIHNGVAWLLRGRKSRARDRREFEVDGYTLLKH